MDKNNSVSIKFAELLSDITDDYKKEDKLLLRVYSAEEVVEMGFCRREIDKIIHGCTDTSVEDFFEHNVSELRAVEFGGLELTDSAGISTVGQMIKQIRRVAVIGFLNLQLSSFIEKLKIEE